MKLLEIEVYTPSKAVYNNKAVSVTVPGTLGSFQVLYNHAPILSSLEIGRVKIEEEKGKKLNFATSGGTIEVLNNKVLLLVESFESDKEIDVERAQKARERAEKRLKKESSFEDKIDMLRAEVALKRAINRLKVSGHYN
jgi:F-type H+-transporting ATPase subunit epsilon